MSELFNTAPIPKQITETIVEVPEGSQQVDDDHGNARSNMYSLIQQGSEALQYAIDLAKQSDSPRAFEVVSQMMKNLADMNQQLLELHQTKAAIDKEKAKQEASSGQPQKVVNNAIFVGSTAELNKMIDNITKGNN